MAKILSLKNQKISFEMANEKDPIANESIENEEMENASEQEVENASSEETIENTTSDNSEVNGTENDSTIDKLTAEVEEYKNKYLRLYADFENFRRRTSKEKLDLLKSAGAETITAILPVLDDFERALKSIESSTDENGGTHAIKEGIDLVYTKLYKTLQQKGLQPMDAVGKEFDSELHEAITQIPAPEENLKGKVIDEVEKGYFLNEKVIRFAKVVIGA